MADSSREANAVHVSAPYAPAGIAEVGVDVERIRDLVLKTAHAVASLTTDAAVRRLCLPAHVVVPILDELKHDRLVEVLGTSGPFGYRYSITGLGRERAARLMEISGYVGPAPVSLEAYTSMLESQLALLPPVAVEQVNDALASLILPHETREVAGLAASSGRSLFIHGPPGNGKTSLGHLIHDAFFGQIWIPHCISVDEDIIRIFDPQCHEPAPTYLSEEETQATDRRWVLVRRPLVVAAGELTIDSLDLHHSRVRGYYDVPMHVKANGGTFLLDDFGRQRVEARQLLNRWVFPLEHGYDYLTLRTGQKISVPFRQMLIVCTNLDPHKVMDPAFLRRMGYRLYLGNPSEQLYSQIFERYAAQCGVEAPPAVIAHVIGRYEAEGRALRSCEPRDLIERARDVCAFHVRPFELAPDVMNVAWTGYFGEKDRLE